MAFVSTTAILITIVLVPVSFLAVLGTAYIPKKPIPTLIIVWQSFVICGVIVYFLWMNNFDPFAFVWILIFFGVLGLNLALPRHQEGPKSIDFGIALFVVTLFGFRLLHVFLDGFL